MKLLHNANNNIEWGAPISQLRSRVSNGLGGVYVFPITSCWPCAPFCYSPFSILRSIFLHFGLSFICLIAHSAHCAILIRCDIVKSDAIFNSFFFFLALYSLCFLHISCVLLAPSTMGSMVEVFLLLVLCGI